MKHSRLRYDKFILICFRKRKASETATTLDVLTLQKEVYTLKIKKLKMELEVMNESREMDQNIKTEQFVNLQLDTMEKRLRIQSLYGVKFNIEEQ
jgi:hypothetical protein